MSKLELELKSKLKKEYGRTVIKNKTRKNLSKSKLAKKVN